MAGTFFLKSGCLPCSLVVLATLCGAQPSSSPPFSDLATKAAAARDANRLAEAAALYTQALQLKPAWSEGWWSLGTIQYDRNEYAGAAAAFRKVAELDAKAGSARIMLGLSEFELGQDRDALLHIQQGEAIGVVDNQQLRNVALFHEGLLLQRAGKWEGAQKALGSLCAAGETDAELNNALGMTVLLLRDRSAPASSPASDVVSGVGAAECLASRKQYDDARAAYGSLVRQFENFPNIHYAYGRFLLDAHDTAAGIAELRQEIDRSPGHVLARLQIAAAEYKVDSAAGLPYAAAAVKIDDRLPLGHYLYGLLLLDTDDAKSAIPQLEQAKRGMEEVPGVYSALAAAYSRVGRTADAAQARAAFGRYNQAAASTSSASPAPQP